MTQFFVEQLSDEEKQIVCSAINTYGDGQHPVATTEGLKYFGLTYVAHCLGRQHYAVIGAGLMKAPEHQDEKHLNLHNAHESILDKIGDAIEFGIPPNDDEQEQPATPAT